MDSQTATNEQLAQAQYAPPFFDDTEFGANSIEPLLEYERMQGSDAKAAAQKKAISEDSEDIELGKSKQTTEQAPTSAPKQAQAPDASKVSEKADAAQASVQSEESKQEEATPPPPEPIIPEKVAQAYVQMDNTFYFGKRPDVKAFVDNGLKLQTKLNNQYVISSMVDIAEARDWKHLQLKGTVEFRREAWLHAYSRGMDVHGYKPTQADNARLKQMIEQRTNNEMIGTPQSETTTNPENAQPESNTSDAQRSKPAATSATDTETATQADRPAEKNAPPAQRNNNQPNQKTTRPESPVPTSNKSDKTQPTTTEKNVHWKNVDPATPDKPAEKTVQGASQKEKPKPNKKTIAKVADILNVKYSAMELLRKYPDMVNEITVLKLAEKHSASALPEDKKRFIESVRKDIAHNVADGKKMPPIKIKAQRERSKEVEKENEEER